MDDTATVEELRCRVRHFVNERDWQTFHTPRNLAESVSIEAAEMLEIFQWGQELDAESTEHLKEELADVLIYCMSMANALEIDISESIDRKLALNAKKYPVERAKGSWTGPQHS